MKRVEKWGIGNGNYGNDCSGVCNSYIMVMGVFFLFFNGNNLVNGIVYGS